MSKSGKLPDEILTWYLYGAGLESFGKDKRPVERPMPEYGPDELLVRVDAVSICFSDIKVINQGDKHPRITGRDMVNDPVTLGHEAAVTVVGVGENVKDRFATGQRFTVQADVFVNGVSMAFGYVLPGAQTQYQVIPKEMLDGDEGSYLLPMADSTGYAEAALAEPWACVVASYKITRRKTIKPGGKLWIICASACDSDYALDFGVDPDLVVATELEWPMLDQLKFWSEAGRFKLRQTPEFDSIDFEEFEQKHGGFDDIIVLGANPDVIEKAATLLAKGGIMNIVAEEPLTRPVKIDVGKVHYQNHAYIGTMSRHVGSAYEPVRRSPLLGRELNSLPSHQLPGRESNSLPNKGGGEGGSELKPSGIAWFVGTGGPMGQMHLPRALELEYGPKKVLATDIDTGRLNSLRARFQPIAERRAIELLIVNPNEMTPEAFDKLLHDFTDGGGFDDIVMLAPVPSLIEQAVPYLAEEGLMNIFAGVPIGTIVSIDLSGVYMCNARFVGSSGSKVSDMLDTLHAAESGEISTNTSVAAIGGIKASWDGMKAAKEGTYPGKIVIYPQITGLPLTALPDLKERLPSVYAKLTDGMFWNREAEAELLKMVDG